MLFFEANFLVLQAKLIKNVLTACLLTTPDKWYTPVTGLLLSIIFELPHGKASKLAYTFSGDPDQPGLPPGLIAFTFQSTVKPALSSNSKIYKTKILITNGSLMKFRKHRRMLPLKHMLLVLKRTISMRQSMS